MIKISQAIRARIRFLSQKKNRTSDSIVKTLRFSLPKAPLKVQLEAVNLVIREIAQSS